MRKLIFAINTSLDGYCEHIHFRPDEELLAYFIQLTKQADTFLYGRNTYQLMVPYWPNIANDPTTSEGVVYEYAQAYIAVSKIVVLSTTLDRAEDEKTIIIRDNLEEEVLKLKRQSGKSILTGGINLTSQLASFGLIDEYHFIVHPVIVGKGRRLFEDANLQEKLQLKLMDTITFKSGAVLMKYGKAG